MAQGLSEAELGHLKYFQSLAEQPSGEWEGFYLTPIEGMNFGLRFQLAFSTYALYAMARRTPAYRAPYLAAIEKLVEKMLRPEVWAYWFQGAVRSLPVLTSGEVVAERKPGAVEVLHSRLGMASSAIPPDPCREGNVQYSGHLACMLGFYELLAGSSRYDEPGFVLAAEARGQRYEFPYTHSSLAARIHEQMAQNYFHGVCCEPGRAYAACNNHACISNVLHDRLHGTNYAAVNEGWGEWVREKMLTGRGPLPLPAPNGLLSVAFMPDLHLPIPVSFNLTDAWGLAFMAAWRPEPVREIYPRFRKRLKRQGQSLKLNSVGPNEKFEISTEGLNTGFALLLAREMGDGETAHRLQRYADEFLEPVQDERGFYYAVRPAPYVTALFALARALPEEGGGLSSLLQWRPDFKAPYLAKVSSSDIYVKQAENIEGEGLVIGLAGKAGAGVELKFENCEWPQHIRLNRIEIAPDAPNVEYNETTRQLLLKLELPGGETELRIENDSPQRHGDTEII